MVKNTVIVPTGSKGGFVVKRPPESGTREDRWPRAWPATGCSSPACSTSPTTSSDGEVVPAADVVRHDGDDTYLVVAADKGTATFSDIANGVAKEYGFWLGDAFASGGSIGYDHKAHGHHRPRRLGVGQIPLPHDGRGRADAPTSPWPASATCPATCSATACCSPSTSGWSPPSTTGTSSSTPTRTPPRSYAERPGCSTCRAAPGPTTTPSLISAGGGVWPRTAKSIPISPADARRARHRATASPRWRPNDLISAILRAPVDLLWNGGIGTYVKASTRVPRRRRRQGQRRAPGQRRRAALQGGRRGRQPGLHPARPDRVRAERRAGQHRLHRQLRRRGHLRPRGEHQDPARPGRPRRRADRRAAQPALHST